MFRFLQYRIMIVSVSKAAWHAGARMMSNNVEGKVVVITVDVNEILFRPTQQEY
jgi:hypothetical protein